MKINRQQQKISISDVLLFSLYYSFAKEFIIVSSCLNNNLGVFRTYNMKIGLFLQLDYKLDKTYTMFFQNKVFFPDVERIYLPCSCFSQSNNSFIPI